MSCSHSIPILLSDVLDVSSHLPKLLNERAPHSSHYWKIVARGRALKRTSPYCRFGEASLDC